MFDNILSISILIAFQMSLYLTLAFIIYKKYGAKSSNHSLIEGLYKERIITQDSYHAIILNKGDQYNLNTIKLFLVLKHYFIIDATNKAVELECRADSTLITTNISVSDIYRLVFSITYYILKICEPNRNIAINIDQSSIGIAINFKIFDNKIHINDIEKYIRKFQPNPDSGIINWSQIMALCQVYDYKFVVMENEICIESKTKSFNNIVYFKKDF